MSQRETAFWMIFTLMINFFTHSLSLKHTGERKGEKVRDERVREIDLEGE